MRRGVGLVLAGLGTCLIVFAVLMPTWVSGKVLKFPLNEYASVILTGKNVSYFSPAKLTELTGVNMEATYTIKGNAAAGSSSTAVWNQFIYVYDQTNKLPFQTMTRTMAFDRRTALLTNCCGSNVNGDSSIEQRGYVGYVLPIGTQQRTYDVFDTSLSKPVPFAFAGDVHRQRHRRVPVRREHPSHAERLPDPPRGPGRPERGVGHPAAVLREPRHLLDRPGHRRAAQRHAEREADAQGLQRCHGPGALRRLPGGDARQRERPGSPG